MTDIAGHSRQFEQAVTTLRTLDAFLGPLVRLARETGVLFVLTSDHGNVEDMSHHSHTLNPVPWVAIGPGADSLRAEVRSLTDVTPGILRLLT
jgi:bisphosphoglycerate-independent phosphoglycerate mutase (AlkP superfamily)